MLPTMIAAAMSVVTSVAGVCSFAAGAIEPDFPRVATDDSRIAA